MSVKRKKDWENFRDKISKKRNDGKKNRGGSSGNLTVQRLSANVEGKCQKYSRIGPLTLVPLDPEKEVNLPNIKAACQAHFKTNLECDVLAGERGPSFTDVSQIENWKVLHVRFIDNASQHTVIDSGPSSTPLNKETLVREPSGRVKTKPENGIIAPSVVASVSLSHMLKARYGEGKITEECCIKCHKLFRSVSLGVFVKPSGSVQCYSDDQDMCDLCQYLESHSTLEDKF